MLEATLRKAKSLGADGAEGVIAESIGLSAAVREGKLADLERSESVEAGIRVMVGKKQASLSTHDVTLARLEALVQRAVSMAREAPDDAYAGFADAAQLAKNFPDLDLYDATPVRAEELRENALLLEAEARKEKKITNVEEARASWGESSFVHMISNGFLGTGRSTGHSLSIEVVAGSGTDMVRDYDYTSTLHKTDMRSVADVAQVAAARTIKRLGARKMPTARIPVVLAPRIASRFLRDILSALSGSAVARKSTFLQDAQGQNIAAQGITILDNPLIPRGLRSRSFDGEGLPTQQRALIEKGELKTFLLNLSSARQLGLQSTAHGTRGAGGTPGISASNVTLEAGAHTPEELIADIAQGFYVTELMGHGGDTLTGDFSQGAAGFWIEKGEVAFPVHEMTIAGNMKDMLKAMSPANDLQRRYGIDAPTLRIEGMTVAGS